MQEKMKEYRRFMDKVEAPEGLIEEVMIRHEERERFWAGLAFGMLRAVVMGAVLCVCFVFSMRVVAGAVPEVYELLYLVSPGTAQYFMPVQKVSENEGIRMEVVSAYIHDNVAWVYITMEDLEGDRVDHTIDLYDSYSIHQPFSAMGHCQRVGFDEETGKAMFLIRITQWEDQQIQGKRITFSVREFMSRKVEYEYLPVVTDLTLADRGAQLTGRWINGRGYGRITGQEGEDIPREELRMLSPGAGSSLQLICEDGSEVTLDEVQLSGLAWSDGLLRVQLRYLHLFQNDNHGYLQLVDQNGELEDYLYSVSFQEKEGQEYTGYEEYVFRVEEEELGQYQLAAHLWITGEHVEGPWQVTFPLEVREDEK